METTELPRTTCGWSGWKGWVRKARCAEDMVAFQRKEKRTIRISHSLGTKSTSMSTTSTRAQGPPRTHRCANLDLFPTSDIFHRIVQDQVEEHVIPSQRTRDESVGVEVEVDGFVHVL
jgi:hypothetical protein